jgi:ABC-2 type transport system ATP-binding protein
MDERTNAIEVRNLAKGYKGVQVLHDVTFTVGRGTVFALLGANGSGKTTTINILTTLIEADGGTARVAGFDVAQQPSKVREQISLTGQSAAVDHVLTARENLELIGELRHVADPGQTAANLLDKFDLDDAADRRLLTFSGGMRRRLDIAMSLVGDSPIIFFDEPTTGLDPKSRNEMWLTIRHLVENGTTVFLTTQYLDEADHLADEIAILHDGRIAASGTPDELKAIVPTGHVELEFGEDEQLSAAQRALGGEREVSRVDSKLVVTTTGSVADMADMFIRLKDSGIEPTGFSSQLPTLDDVFFKILDDDTEDRHASAH